MEINIKVTPDSKVQTTTDIEDEVEDDKVYDKLFNVHESVLEILLRLKTIDKTSDRLLTRFEQTNKELMESWKRINDGFDQLKNLNNKLARVIDKERREHE